ncbi:MAG: twin-arginine translocase TatA/TatE family subunit [Prevotellaceae bacterium]|nr:twin-arginine translocase TatA/TatE family subunit [Prevotellaceae bacterium]
MITPLFLGLGMQEILVILLIVLLLFGGKKIPELMRGAGKGVRAFKDGMKEVTSDEETTTEKPTQTTTEKSAETSTDK